MVCPSPLFGFSVYAQDWSSAFHLGHCVIVGSKSSDIFLLICNCVPPFLAPSVPAATESGHTHYVLHGRGAVFSLCHLELK